MSKIEKYPFIYIYHGKPIDVYSFQGEKYFIFCFSDNISQQTAERIEESAPKIISGSTLWTGNLYMNYSISDEDEITGYYLKKRKCGYDDELNDKFFMRLYTDFAEDIESWTQGVNQFAPIDFFIGHNRIGGSKWDKYSETKLPEVIRKLDLLADDADDRAKRIINETAIQILHGKNRKLTTEMKARLTKLEKSTG
ncbi:MAG TPA: hypothetical protein PKE39_11505 [Ignavibacteria bacterium]|nr:hypothetical protein [Ignavibacteria bacterium]HMQ99640.1 hypothetical protein [Ignavibacteria bacterium]